MPTQTAMQSTLRPGSFGDEVAELQQRLAGLGYKSAADDGRGIYGEATAEAVTQFQSDRRIRVDGICGPQTWTTLKEAEFRLGDRLISLRSPMMRGEDIAELQRKLSALGFDTGRVDGIYGPDTSAALTQFQRNIGITPDGIFGRATAQELSQLASRAGAGHLAEGVREDERLRHLPRNVSAMQLGIGGSPSLLPVWNSLLVHLVRMGAATCRLDGSSDSENAKLANESGANAVLYIAERKDDTVGAASDDTPSPGCVRVATYYYSGFKYESKGGLRLAQSVVSSMRSSTEFEALPPTGLSIPILRETRMPAVLCELESAQLPLNLLESAAQRLALAIEEWVTGIVVE